MEKQLLASTLLAWSAATGISGAQTPPPPPPPRVQEEAWLHSEVSAQQGLYVLGYRYYGGAQATPFYTIGATGRFQRAPRGGFADHLTFAGGVVGAIALGRKTASSGVASVASVGLAYENISVSLGVFLHADATPAPVQILPSLAATLDPGPFAVTVGVLDRPVGPLAHVTVEIGSFGVGYAAPLGAEAYFRPSITDWLALDAYLFGYTVFNSFNAGGTLGVVFRLLPSKRPGGAS